MHFYIESHMADYITNAPDEDGVYNAFLKFKLISVKNKKGEYNIII